MKLFLIYATFVYSICAYDYISPELKPLTDEIVNAVNALNVGWKAGKNFDESTSIEMNRLFSTLNETFHEDFPRIHNSTADVTSFPTFFDARTAWPNCSSIGKIYDQRKGFPSWIYASVGQIADRLCIKYGVQIDVEATVERMTKANGGFDSEHNSANFVQAFNYWSEKGIFTIQNSDGCLPFAKVCKTKEIQLDKYYKVDVVTPRIATDKMQDLMLNGPISMEGYVYTDFPSYKSGVYAPTSRVLLGKQILKIIGFGSENGQRYWLIANSWGTQWGDKGLYKLRQATGECTSKFVSVLLQSIDHISSIPKSFEQDQLFDLA